MATYDGSPNADTYTGVAGEPNIINGMGGNDTLTGGPGSTNDIINGGDDNDSINGAGGSDELYGGPGDDDLRSGVTNASSQFRTIIDGGTGADTMVGDDFEPTVYYVDNVGDVVDERGGAERDEVRATISYTLAPAQTSNGFSDKTVEDLTLLGTGNIDATGNDAGNFIYGNAGNNVITPMGGHDRVSGGGGSDTFVFDLVAGANSILDYDPANDTLVFNWLAPGETPTVSDLNGLVFYTADVPGGGTFSLLFEQNEPPTGSLTIGGQPGVGENLTAIDALIDGNFRSFYPYQYQWLADGVAIPGALDEISYSQFLSGATSTYMPTANQLGAEITVRITYRDNDGYDEEVTSAAITVATNDPVSGSVTIDGTPGVGLTVTAVPTIADDNGLGNFSYQWLADGAPIDGATMATFTPTATQAGADLSVNISFVDAAGFSESISSGPVTVIENNPATGSVTIDGVAEAFQLLTAVPMIADSDGLGTFSYQWFFDEAIQYAGIEPVDIDIIGATGATFTADFETITYVFTDAAETTVPPDIGGPLALNNGRVRVAVRVTYTDGAGFVETLESDSLQLSEGIGSASVVTIEGTLIVGAILTAVPDIADANELLEFGYQWLADGEPIAGATGTTFTLTQAQSGANMTVRIDYTNTSGSFETVASASQVIAVNQPATGAVTIDGEARVGEVLTAVESLEDADGIAPGPFLYQWVQNGTAIPGATGMTYTLPGAALNQDISVEVSFTDNNGVLESISSATPVTIAIAGYTVTTFDDIVADDGLISLREAIGAANGQSGPVSITLPDGTYDLTGGQLNIFGDIAIEGGQRDTTRLTHGSAPQERFFFVSTGATLVLSALTLDSEETSIAPSNGRLDGGALYNQGGTVEIIDAAFLNNRVYGTELYGTERSDGYYYDYKTADGGAVYNEAGAISISDSVFSGNAALYGGAIFATGGTMDITDTRFDGNLVSSIREVAVTSGKKDTFFDDDLGGLGADIFSTGSSQILLDGNPFGVGQVHPNVIAGPVPVVQPPSAVTMSQAAMAMALAGDGAELTLTEGLSLAPEDYYNPDYAMTGVLSASATRIVLQLVNGQLVINGIDLMLPIPDPTSEVQTLEEYLATVGGTVMSVALMDVDGTQVQATLTDLDAPLAELIGAVTEDYDPEAPPTLEVVLDAPVATTVSTTPLELPPETPAVLLANVVASVAEDADTGARIKLADIVITDAAITSADLTLGGADAALFEIDGTGLFLVAGASLDFETDAQLDVTLSGGGDSAALALLVTDANDAPTGGVTISGTVTEGETLTANSTLADQDGIGTLSYQWLRDGAEISGANSATYVPTAADVGEALSVAVDYIDGNNIAESVTSGETAAIEAASNGQNLSGGDGNETLTGGADNDTVSGNGGDDSVSGAGGDDTVSGGPGNDRVNGNDGNDVTSGAAGNDVVNGGPGNDNMGGGTGDDTMDGGSGNDTMGGGQGNDSMDGGVGNDIVNGGGGDDFTQGGEGNDTMGASFGNDTVDGGAGDDSLGGGTGRDSLIGGLGDDALGGGEGDDTVDGGDGDDFVAGGGRNDIVLGGAGDDRINGGDGDDTMTGGVGADVFIYNFFKDGDADVITDFEDGIDMIRMVGVQNEAGSGNAGRVAALNITDTAAGALVSYDVTFDPDDDPSDPLTHTILFEGITASQLTTDDFVFLG